MHKMCQTAVQQGLNAIAFTEHKEWAGRFYAPFSPLEAYFDDIQTCRRDYAARSDQPLIILSGVEMGNPHEHVAKATRLLEANEFDITVGSLHRLYDVNIHNIRCFRGRDVNRVFSDYFQAAEHMVLDFEFDILAHFDRILWRPTLSAIPYDIRAVEGDVRALFEAVIERDVLVELNTKIFRIRPRWHNALETMLVWYREAGGERVLVNSDAHRRQDIAAGFDDAAQMLNTVGLGIETGAHLLQSFRES